MSERLTPYEPPAEAKETTRESPPLSKETEKSIQIGPETTKPGDRNHPAEGHGQGQAWRDAENNLVTPERQELHKTPESLPEKEPRTYRAGAADAGQAPSGTADAPTAPPKPQDTRPPADKLASTAGRDVAQRSMSGQLTAEDEALLRSARADQARLDQEAKADVAKWDAEHRARQPDTAQKAMQGPPDETYYPRLPDDLKLQLSTIQDMPLDQRQAAMAELFQREGQTLSNNAVVDGHGVKVKDASGFTWDIRYDA